MLPLNTNIYRELFSEYSHILSLLSTCPCVVRNLLFGNDQYISSSFYEMFEDALETNLNMYNDIIGILYPHVSTEDKLYLISTVKIDESRFKLLERILNDNPDNITECIYEALEEDNIYVVEKIIHHRNMNKWIIFDIYENLLESDPDNLNTFLRICDDVGFRVGFIDCRV